MEEHYEKFNKSFVACNKLTVYNNNASTDMHLGG